VYFFTIEEITNCLNFNLTVKDALQKTAAVAVEAEILPPLPPKKKVHEKHIVQTPSKKEEKDESVEKVHYICLSKPVLEIIRVATNLQFTLIYNLTLKQTLNYESSPKPEDSAPVIIRSKPSSSNGDTESSSPDVMELMRQICNPGNPHEQFTKTKEVGSGYETEFFYIFKKSCICKNFCSRF